MKRFHPQSASAKLAAQSERVVRPRIAERGTEFVNHLLVEEKAAPILGPSALNTHFFDG